VEVKAHGRRSASRRRASDGARDKVWAVAPAALRYDRSVFSKRTRWDLTTNRLSQLLARKRRQGIAVLDLTESNPTRAGLVADRDLLAPLASEASLRYEPAPLGLPSVREAVAADFRARGLDLPAERVVVTASTSESYAFLFKLLCDSGDAVLVPRPSYPLFGFLAQLESVAVESYALRYDDEWSIDLAELRATLDGHARARAICVVHPNNPTGSFVKREEATELLALAADRGLAVISDEVFADYAFAPDGRRHASFASDGPALAFALGGLSKSCGMPQVKLGWIAVAGPDEQRRAALARLELIADTYLSVATPTQVAAPTWLAQRQRLTRPIAARVAANLTSLRERLVRAPASGLLNTEGGWYAVLRVPATMTEEERVLDLLERLNVLVHPGFFFDFPHEAYIVVSLLPEGQVFREGLARLIGALE
jgi:alanine-synthesizing transaminase